MMRKLPHSEIEALMRDVARDIVMPRFRNLASHEVSEKAADDFVTIADKESEVRLEAGLRTILPDAEVLGEEATAANPALLDSAGTGLTWIIDPIDGTGNFAAGRAPFGIMVALVDDGELIGGWILDPLAGRFCRAGQGEGAWLDGVRIASRGSGKARPVVALASYFMTQEQLADIHRRADGVLELVQSPRCAAEQYPRLALGVNDIGIFERSLPWDHAAGALFLNEAGGRLSRQDGTAYRVGDKRRGLLAASTPDLWDHAARILFG